MRYCGRCWKERKGWLPERPKPKHPRRKGSSKKNKRTEGQAVKSSQGSQGSQEVPNTSAASGSSEPSGSSQETLPDSGTGTSHSQELFSPNEEDECRLVHAFT